MPKTSKKPVAKKPATKKPTKQHSSQSVSPQKKSTAAASAKARRLKMSRRRFHRTPKQFRPVRRPLPGVFRLFGRSLAMLKNHPRLFGGILLIYALLSLVLVHGFAGSGTFTNLKTVFDQIFAHSGGRFSSSLSLFVVLLGNSSTSPASVNSGVYQAILIVLTSLGLIWALRQTYASAKVRLRDSFYLGMYPLVPFLLILLVIGLELVPVLIGGNLYSLASSNNLIVGGAEKTAWIAVVALLGLASLYFICSSIFALYIVTLPDMTPMKALRSARELVRWRRLAIVRKLIFLPIAFIVIAAVVLVPLIIWAAPAAPWVYFSLSLLGLAVLHSYLYALYRELL